MEFSRRIIDNFAIIGLMRDNEVGAPEVLELSKGFYSPREVAELARVHPSTILNYIGSGRLYAVKLSERTYRIPARAVIGLLEPRRLSRSTMTVDREADVEHELTEEPAGTAVSA